MRLFLLSQHLLVFISVLSLTRAETISPATTANSVAAALPDPCNNYTMLDALWRATNNQVNQQYVKIINSDCHFNWVGWYRLFINGQSVRMPNACVKYFSCGTHIPLWLNGGHPTVQDGVVTRAVCGTYGGACCHFNANSIRVKACPGGYYVYEFVFPNVCASAYCADVSNVTNAPVSTSAAPQIFYPFGPASGDTINPAVSDDDDGSSPVIQLMSAFVFFNRTYQQIYVNNNGFLTFSQPSRAYAPYSFPANGSQDIIAGLWMDIDNRVRGAVSYHQYTSGNVLTRATQDINNHFPNLNFNASWVFVATWDKVAYYPLTDTETSFQVVLISGSNFSFILMNYGNISITGYQVEAGFDTVNSTNYFVIPGSKNGSSISNLRSSSNVNVPGRWAFRVDGGINSSKDTIIGLQMRLSSYLDLTDSGNIQIVLQQIKHELVKYGLSNSAELKLRKVQKIKP